VRAIETEIEIDAPPARVWAVLIDFATYPTWNPFVRRIAGEPSTGARLDVLLGPPGKRPMRFRPTVLRAEPERELRWLGHLLVRGLFDGEHAFELEPLGADRTRLRQSERFGGLLVPLVGGLLAETRRGFVAMNEALKARAEQR
jgi:hypothetical protein